MGINDLTIKKLKKAFGELLFKVSKDELVMKIGIHEAMVLTAIDETLCYYEHSNPFDSLHLSQVFAEMLDEIKSRAQGNQAIYNKLSKAYKKFEEKKC